MATAGPVAGSPPGAGAGSAGSNGPAQAKEYATNIRQLLALNEKRFSLMVERQIQFALLGTLKGSAVELLPPLWDLTTLCIFGPAQPVTPFDPQAFQTTAASDSSAWRFPNAARSLIAVIQTLLQHGMYPEPIVKTGTAKP